MSMRASMGEGETLEVLGRRRVVCKGDVKEEGACRCGADSAESKPRDLGSDRGYRVAIANVTRILGILLGQKNNA
jgi:hypothetical protein